MGVTRRVGIMTGGGDCPGLNAVIRAVAKPAILAGMEVVGIEDGYLGLIEDRMHLRRCVEQPSAVVPVPRTNSSELPGFGFREVLLCRMGCL